MELIHLLKRLLYEEKYTIEGANRRIQGVRRTGDLEEARRNALEPEILSGITEELENVRKLLT